MLHHMIFRSICSTCMRLQRDFCKHFLYSYELSSFVIDTHYTLVHKLYVNQFVVGKKEVILIIFYKNIN